MAKFAYKTRCQNESGWYTVIAEPVGGRMTVQFDDGKMRLLKVDEQLPFLNRRKASLRESSRLFPESSRRDGGYWTFLGFLAATCHVDAHIPESQKAGFVDDYRRLTGIDLSGGEAGFTTAAAAQWGFSMRIYFPSAILDLLPGLDVAALKTEISDGRAAINNKRLCYELLQMGFRLARGHDVDGIRESVPPEHVAAFDKGLELGRAARPAG